MKSGGEGVALDRGQKIAIDGRPGSACVRTRGVGGGGVPIGGKAAAGEGDGIRKMQAIRQRGEAPDARGRRAL